MYWSKALRITAITDRFTRDRFFRLRGSIKVLIDDDVPEDLRKRDKFWKVEEEEVGLGLGGLVLARLCQTLHRGTKVYCDRFFTSIRGVEQMMKKEMYITGTIMKNRLAGAKEKLPSDKTMKNTGRGTSSELSTEDGKLCVVKWYDNKPVLMMSVVQGTEPEDTCQRWDKKLKQYVTVSRPSIVREYNLKMGGVDLIDRMISYYRMSARTKKWTMRMLMHFTDLALANSWLLYRKDFAICAAPKKSIMQFLEFRTEMATTLLAQHHGQGSDADLSEQRANAHLPEMISLKNAARCRVAGCTGRTRVRCVTCKVFLCLQGDRNCYTAFHT
ncbi:PiggyBac transposable element-derived protein 3 [Dissostichus eleginoides]|uniref:PiggyBac transposable element-derived protein 3 n=1 Tax=Dissostichus eleginoides TaxID=100907 RepID=A0AAD9CMC6_DISEL|nr:PiggyBac transposable element-derived protein 3 [Dissostichus eleginoides]